ncbi:hypothetical protein DIPPA_32866 [Diplonema papillatum]|nr:hypothetical protein DIPPA_32866 [Diplonema papillatum]KAJ9457863.1 hypothetical protein DIPPA_32866 [Diplonema papillatum]KAJ9457864.1 hypothetical protein DIPPA_32866 [Diplonema papillatum]
MASQHNRSSSYRALIEGRDRPKQLTREEELHQKLMELLPEDERDVKRPHGLPAEEELNQELKSMKVNPRSYSSIAGAGSSTFHQYRFARRTETNRLEKMYSEAEHEIKARLFEQRKREREEAEAEKTSMRASKRNKKKEGKKKRAELFKQQKAAGAAQEQSSDSHEADPPAAAAAAAAGPTAPEGSNLPFAKPSAASPAAEAEKKTTDKAEGE